MMDFHKKPNIRPFSMASPFSPSSRLKQHVVKLEQGMDEVTRQLQQQLEHLQQQQQQPPFLSPSEKLSIVSGIVTFGSTLALSTFTQGRLLHVSTGTPGPFPTILGVATVCIASLASHHVSCTVHKKTCNNNKYPQTLRQYWDKGQHRLKTFATSIRQTVDDNIEKTWKQSTLKSTLDEIQTDIHTILLEGRKSSPPSYNLQEWFRRRRKDGIDVNGYFHIPYHTIGICCVGLLAFKLLGGRFWAIAPSSYTHVGSFARTYASIPATERYATSMERTTIERFGRIFGCHTCGSRMILPSFNFFNPLSKITTTSTTTTAVRFVGDHMPPKSVAEQLNSRWYRKMFGRKVQYRFYPQCITCSSKQGSILSKATDELRRRTIPGSRIPDLSQAGGGSNAYFHGLRIRINHFTGGIVSAVAVVGTSTGSSSNDNKYVQRYYDWSKQFRKVQQQTNQFVQNILY